MNKSPLSGLIALLALSAAARGGEAKPPTLEEMLSGGRQKGTPVPPSLKEFLSSLGLDPRPFDEAPEDLKEQVRADIRAGKVEVTEGCDCEFCSWVKKQPEWLRPNEGPKAGPKVVDMRPGARFEQEYGGAESSAKTVPGILREAAATYESRNPLYGDAYKHYGAAMMAFFPLGLTIGEPEDWNRFGLFSMMVSKMSRLANNMTTGGHYDSALDLSVYAAMMAELTEIK